MCNINSCLDRVLSVFKQSLIVHTLTPSPEDVKNKPDPDQSQHSPSNPGVMSEYEILLSTAFLIFATVAGSVIEKENKGHLCRKAYI